MGYLRTRFSAIKRLFKSKWDYVFAVLIVVGIIEKLLNADAESFIRVMWLLLGTLVLFFVFIVLSVIFKPAKPGPASWYASGPFLVGIVVLTVFALWHFFV